MCLNSKPKIISNLWFLITLILCSGSGCTSTKSEVEKTKTIPKSVASNPQNSAGNCTESIVVPAQGFSWDELAAIAARRSDDTYLKTLQIKCNDLQNQADRAWRSPQLRLNSGSTRGDQYTSAGNSKHDESTDYGTSIRFYISNPFVNHWIKRQAGVNARSIAAQSDALAYAVYCETSMKCCEAAIIEDELNQLKEAFQQQKKIYAQYRQQQSGATTPLKIIKAELKSAKIEQQIEVAERRHRSSLFQIAALTDLPIDKIKVRSIDQQSIPEPSAYHADDLLKSAVNLRPDLENIRCRIALAKSRVEIAKAHQIPWFEFLETGYRNRDADATTYSAAPPNRSNSDSDEWTIRVAIALPVFEWAGNATALARNNLREIEYRESLALTALHNEIRIALENYTEAHISHERIKSGVRQREQTFQRAIKALNSSKAGVETEIMETEEQLNAYSRGARQTLYNCLKQKLYLESVTGMRAKKFVTPEKVTN